MKSISGRKNPIWHVVPLDTQIPLNAKSEGPRPNLGTSRRPIILKLGRGHYWHQYWTNDTHIEGIWTKFWKWLIFALSGLWSWGSRDRSKNWPRPILSKFTADLDIDPLNWFGTVKTYEIDFRPKKSDLTRGSTWHTNTLNAKSEDPRPNLGTSRRPIILKLVRVTTGINTERMTPILKESEQVLKMANFCSIWPGGWGVTW